MKRSMQEIVELLVFALIALLVGTGVVWLVGWVLELAGTLLIWLAGLVWSLLRFLVPIAIVAAAVYALVRLMNRHDRPESGPREAGTTGTAGSTTASPPSSTAAASTATGPAATTPPPGGAAATADTPPAAGGTGTPDTSASYAGTTTPPVGDETPRRDVASPLDTRPTGAATGDATRDEGNGTEAGASPRAASTPETTAPDTQPSDADEPVTDPPGASRARGSASPGDVANASDDASRAPENAENTDDGRRPGNAGRDGHDVSDDDRT